jgi:hypothetical protein
VSFFFFRIAIENSRIYEIDSEKYTVAVNGGRCDANLVKLTKHPIYWDGETVDIKRCLWFYKENNEQRFKPYDDIYADFLEKNFENTINNNLFHKKIVFDSDEDEAFVFHSTSIMLHFVQAAMLDEFGNINVSISLGIIVCLFYIFMI